MNDLNFALLFNWPAGQIAALGEVEKLLPGSERVRGALVYKKNALKFEKNPLQGEVDEMDLQLSAFPIEDEVELAYQRQVFREVHQALQSFVGKVVILAEDELLSDPT